MLFDPSILLTSPLKVLAIVAIIVAAKPLAAFLIVVALRRPARTGLIVGAGLAQIGEFSFILAELGRSLGMLPDEGYNLILAGALISITINPVLFRAIAPLEAWLGHRPAPAGDAPIELAQPIPRDHVVLCGYGRAGRLLEAGLERQGIPYVVVDQDRGLIEELQHRGVPARHGDVLEHGTLKQMHLETARLLVVAMSDALATRHLVEQANRAHPDLPIIARTHSESERKHLREHGVDAILAEQELALTMNRHALARLGCAVPEDAEEVRLQAV